MTSKLQNASGAATSFGSKLSSMVGTGAAMQVGMRAVNTAISAVTSNIGAAVSRVDTLNQFPKIMNQMGLASEKSANKVKDNLVKSIEGLPTSLDEIVASTKSLAVLTGDLDTASDTAVALNDAFLASGSSSADASRGLTQYSQMLAKGKVDQQSWNTLCETMGYGLDKTAKAMLGSEANQRDLYAALQDGTVSFDDFNEKLIELDKAEGGFADTARTASTGIATSFSNVNTAIVAGLGNSVNAIDEAMKSSGVKWLEGGIAGTLNNVKTVVADTFEKINKGIASINIEGIVKGLTPAFKVLKTVAEGVGWVLSKVLGFLNNHAEGSVKAAIAVVGLATAFKALKKAANIKKALSGTTNETIKFKKPADLAAESSAKLKKGLGSFAKLAGVAAIIASLALLTNQLTKLGALGDTAVAPLTTFGIVVAGLATVFAITGKKLQSSAVGIVAFSAAVSAMAASMSGIAETGTEGAVAMTAFGIVVAGLAVVFALLGTTLTAGAIGIVAFGASVALIGYGLKQATPFVTALGTAASKTGNAVSVAANGIGDGFMKISEGTTRVVNAISGGFTRVLNAVAGVIESIGTSARNAGIGFDYTAQGIQKIASLSVWDIGKSLAAVATGMAEISASGRNLPEIGAGVQQMTTGIAMGAVGLASFNTQLVQLSTLTRATSVAVLTLSNTFATFTIPKVNAKAFVATFKSVILVAKKTVPAVTSAGTKAGTGFASGLHTGISKANSIVSNAVSSINASVSKVSSKLSKVGTDAGAKFAKGLDSSIGKAKSTADKAVAKVNTAFRSGYSVARSAGAYISQGFANGMLSCVGTIESAASRMVSAANKAIEVKAKIASPSKVTTEYGEYYGIGWVNGIKEKFNDAKKAAAELMTLPNVKQPALATAGMSLNSEHSYGNDRSFTVEVPVVMDGKEVARITAPYTEVELNKRETRANRKKGIR